MWADWHRSVLSLLTMLHGTLESPLIVAVYWQVTHSVHCVASRISISLPVTSGNLVGNTQNDNGTGENLMVLPVTTDVVGG